MMAACSPVARASTCTLVDGLGEERDAIKYLEEKRGVTKALPIVDWKPDAPASAGLKLFSVCFDRRARLRPGERWPKRSIN